MCARAVLYAAPQPANRKAAMYPQQQPYAPPRPPRRRRSNAPLVLVFAAIGVLGALAAVVLVLAAGNDAKPTTPVPSEAVPAADLGAGTPGAPCATNRLGKTFTKDGVVYTCKGPKPYSWQP